MKLSALAAAVLGTFLALTAPPRRDERGLSGSAETAVLLAGAAIIAAGIVTAITIFVQDKMPR